MSNSITAKKKSQKTLEIYITKVGLLAFSGPFVISVSFLAFSNKRLELFQPKLFSIRMNFALTKCKTYSMELSDIDKTL